MALFREGGPRKGSFGVEGKVSPMFVLSSSPKSGELLFPSLADNGSSPVPQSGRDIDLPLQHGRVQFGGERRRKRKQKVQVQLGGGR